MRHTIPQRGRPKKEGGALIDKSIGLDPEVIERLEDRVRETRGKVSFPEFVRKAVDKYLDPEPVMVADVDRQEYKFLGEAPCGPWEEAIDRADYFPINSRIADELQARDGDVIVRAVGESMEGAGIPDHALLLMRPLVNNRPPGRNRTALVQFVNEHGEYKATIKTWAGQDRLVDGSGNDFEVPEGAKIFPVAEAVGIISSLI
jgi:hypothetical protein